MVKLAIKNYKYILGFLLTAHVLFFYFFKFIAWPEMTFWPYLMINEWLPYKDIAIVHTPILLYLLKGFYNIFGVGVFGLKIFTWGLILLTDILLFGVVKKLFNKRTALWSLLFYIPLQLFYEGNGLWFDLALAPLALGTFYFLKKKRFILSGLIWGLAFFTKQTAVWFLIPILFILLNAPLKTRFLKVAIKFAYGAAVVFLGFGLIFLKLQIWSDFYNWAIQFGVFTLPSLKGQIFLPSMKVLFYSLFAFLAVAPFLKKGGKQLREVFFWSLFLLLGAFPRFELFHFQPALPFLAISFGLIFSKKGFLIYKKIAIIGLSALFVRSLVVNFGQETRFVNENVIGVSSYIDEVVNTGDEIFLVNLWDNIYVLSGTVPATKPFVPGLEWYWEQPGVQEGMVKDLKADIPKVILVGEFRGDGLASYRPELILEFVDENYELADTIDGVSVYRPI